MLQHYLEQLIGYFLERVKLLQQVRIQIPSKSNQSLNGEEELKMLVKRNIRKLLQVPGMPTLLAEE